MIIHRRVGYGDSRMILCGCYIPSWWSRSSFKILAGRKFIAYDGQHKLTGVTWWWRNSMKETT